MPTPPLEALPGYRWWLVQAPGPLTRSHSITLGFYLAPEMTTIPVISPSTVSLHSHPSLIPSHLSVPRPPRKSLVVLLPGKTLACVSVCVSVPPPPHSPMPSLLLSLSGSVDCSMVILTSSQYSLICEYLVCLSGSELPHSR